MQNSQKEKQESRELLRLLNLESLQAAKESLLDFIIEIKEDFKDEYDVNWHHEEICAQLDRVLDEKKLRLMIWVPPQYGKSEIVSRFFPAWLLGVNPKLRIILSSYSADLAESFNRDVQKIVASEKYREIFPDVEFERLTSKISETTKGGYLYAVGVGGTTTGFRADVFICDDPIKDLQDAFSKKQREAKINWFNSVAQSRCSKHAPIIVMHTRWHQKDLAGTLIQKSLDDPNASKYEVICFPATYDPDHPFCSPLDHRTELGEALWPEYKGNESDLNGIRADVGSYVWSALFNQSPKVEGGNIIKDDWIKYYSKLPFEPDKVKSVDLVGSWDLQFKDTGTSYTCGGIIAKYKADFYLLDFYHKKADVIESQRAIKMMADAWPNCRVTLIEDKANGPAIISLLKREVTGLIPVKPDASKDERLHAVAPIFEAGNFYLPMNHPKTRIIVDELTTFPASANDDIVDMISQGLNRFGTLKGLRYLRAYAK